MATSQVRELALECKRQSESCLYSSTALFIWLRVLRIIRVVYLVATFVLGALAGWQLLKNSPNEHFRIMAGLFAVLAGLLPTIYSALKFDEHLVRCADLAAEFKNLQDRFRQAALITSRRPLQNFECEVAELMRRLERAREPSVTSPEWCFRKAQAKIRGGDYTFEVDMPEADSGAAQGLT